MRKLLSGDVLKVDQAIVPQNIAAAAQAISAYVPLGRERKALLAVEFISADLDRGDQVEIGIVDDSAVAPAASGDLAALVAAGDAGVKAYQLIQPATQATIVAIDLTAAADGALTINGVVFPYDAAPVPGTGEWDGDAALVAEILALLPQLNAVAEGANVVRSEPAVPGEATVTLVSTVTAVIDADIVTRNVQAYLEVDASELVPGATTIAAVIDNSGATGTITAAAMWLRSDARYVPVPQQVA